jgi:hypothetical protein
MSESSSSTLMCPTATDPGWWRVKPTQHPVRKHLAAGEAVTARTLWGDCGARDAAIAQIGHRAPVANGSDQWFQWS